MARKLSEQVVKKKLGINSFRELTKDKVIDLASMIDKMDPEVAKKALDQFPEFAETNKEILQEYKGNLDTLIAQNKDSTDTYYDYCGEIIDALKKELDKEDLAFEARKYIIDQMKEVAIMVSEKDSENKKFLFAMAALGGTIVTILGATLATTLGGNIKLFGSNDDDDLEDDYE